MYNDCFILTGVAKTKTGKTIKRAMRFRNNKVITLFKWDYKKKEVIEENLKWYHMNFFKLQDLIAEYYKNGNRTKGDTSLRIGVWLEDAKWNDLDLLCVDFDSVNGVFQQTPFTEACESLADFITFSRSGGKHCWFGVNYETAKPLFQELNLTTHKHTKSFVCSISLTSNGTDKFDVFCRNGRIIYEFQPWEINRGVTDKTIELYRMFQQYVKISEKPDIDYWEDAEGKEIVLEGLPASEIEKQLDKRQKQVFKLLLEKDASCKRNEWFFTGCNIKAAFGNEIGGSIWLLWSKSGDNFQPQACVNTWGEICRRKEVFLRDEEWEAILEENAFSIMKPEKNPKKVKQYLNRYDEAAAMLKPRIEKEKSSKEEEELFSLNLFV